MDTMCDFTGDISSKVKVIPDYFQVPTSTGSQVQPTCRYKKRSRKAASLLNLFTLRRLPWGASDVGQENIVVAASELESLRSKLADSEDREAYSKAQVEHVDATLRSARHSGYLNVRTWWMPLQNEPPPVDDAYVDDWLPKFVVLHGTCIFFYVTSTDLSPQEAVPLADIAEVGPLPPIAMEDEETRYCFYILTRLGLRFECSHVSKAQVASWLWDLESLHEDQDN